MAGWSAMAGTHTFVVPDEDVAAELADALLRHRFPATTARPWRPAGSFEDTGWLVTAYDPGPYAVDEQGRRDIEAVARVAAGIAREHGGYPQGGTRCAATALDMAHLREPIVRTNPGTRPPIPHSRRTAAPRPRPLALTPDPATAELIDLPGLADVPWATLEHAHGPATDIPGLLQELAAGNDDQWAPVLDELLGDNLLHQGSCYSATAPAIPFLARLATSGALPARRRLDLYTWLLIAADRHAESLIDDADRAAVHDGVPQAAAWTDDVHTAVGEQVPALLAQWATEPEATRFVLAALAALYPDQSSHLVGDITAAVQGHQGTQAGAYLQLAAALLANDSDEVLALAQDIVAWDDEIEADWLEAPGVSTTTRCGHVLAQGTLGQLNNLEE